MKTGLVATVTAGVLMLDAPFARAEVVYLMIPPWVATDKVDLAAPLPRWTIISTSDSAKACTDSQLELLNIADAESDEAVRVLAIRMALKVAEKSAGGLKGVPSDALETAVASWTKQIRAMHPSLKKNRPALGAARCIGSSDPRLAIPR